MISNHPFIFSALLVVSWIWMYYAGGNDARKSCNAAFKRYLGTNPACANCGRNPHSGVCKS